VSQTGDIFGGKDCNLYYFRRGKNDLYLTAKHVLENFGSCLVAGLFGDG